METRITQYGGLDIKCRNFEICENWFIFENLQLHSGELCTPCDETYSDWKNGNYGNGILIFQDNIECPICLENKRCVKFPNCSHYVCVDDFKRVFYGDENLKNEPKFPYPELEDDYFLKNQGHSYYENDPEIIKYHQDWNNWDDLRDQKYSNEENLRKCPICRS